MDSLLQKILDAAAAAGGKITYPEFLKTVDYKEQSILPRTIKLGKSKGTLFSYIEYDAANKSNIHWLSTTSPVTVENN